MIEVFEEINPPSNKAFGVTFGFTFIFLALLLQFFDYGWYLDVVPIVISIVMFGFAIFAPQLLDRLKKAWFHFGILLAKLTNPILLGFLYVFLVSPVAIIRRFFTSRDELNLRTRAQPSYWKLQKKESRSMYDFFTNQY